MDASKKPQILEHLSKSLNVTVYDTRWIPSSAKFVVLGSHARATGCLQVYEVAGTELNLVAETETKDSLKCGTFGASGLIDRRLATGDFKGVLNVWDLENLGKPVFQAQAHTSIINSIDGCGGAGKGYGAPELATCGRDGRVCIWDTRQEEAPVATLEPENPEKARDCWTVAFGNSFNDDERAVLAGYDNGDVKLFDLRTNRVRWETNVKNGVCGVEFDRKDIQMNKLVVSTLESQFHVFDARTQHPTAGMASLTEKMVTSSTVWGCRHMPQNRDVFAICGGDGSVNLYKYVYPDQRVVKDEKGVDKGVAGSVELLNSRVVSTQPICSFDWSPDKEGLCVMGAFDQCVRVGVVTKTNLI
mmetsp:Transcript_69846/g.221264  ORF Transcript_69846/g.221264 Transcript_69846/m.221264 type:complete len:359 (-) Transcript_69846:112-1188(-)|eukprot:CAMPEP_0182909086 /NCGR_PEP_ID=MMETSP0034_2-20130328/35561_1 /TAXON_ID=156128 /ORGANISM="Nephroselmis pyriformis, Strain CCMP717" /LENGTH=358 /DNA_ID=CAMNT_0025045317 /DNA_START=208 /DNA_END=1284 /DNA_ORIENTATION=+